MGLRGVLARRLDCRSFQPGMVSILLPRSDHRRLLGARVHRCGQLRVRQQSGVQMTEPIESKIKRLERDLEQPISAACRAETVRVLELLRKQIVEQKS